MLVTPVCLSLMRLQSSAKRNILLLFYSSLANFNTWFLCAVEDIQGETVCKLKRSSFVLDDNAALIGITCVE